MTAGAQAYVGAVTALDPRHPLRPYQHLMAKIEAAAGVTITLRHFEDDEDFPDGWSAMATRDEEIVGVTSMHTAASEWGDGAFEALDKLAAALRVSVDDDGAELAKVA